MSDKPRESIADDWSRTIGTFITSFAYVELLVYELFEMLPQDSVARSHNGLRDFSDRARLLQALIRSSKWEEKGRIEDTIEKLLPLATLRNQLAHNPMFIDLYTDGRDIIANPCIVHAKKQETMDHITLEQLHIKLGELSALIEELALNVGLLRGTTK